MKPAIRFSEIKRKDGKREIVCRWANGKIFFRTDQGYSRAIDCRELFANFLGAIMEYDFEVEESIRPPWFRAEDDEIAVPDGEGESLK